MADSYRQVPNCQLQLPTSYFHFLVWFRSDAINFLASVTSMCKNLPGSAVVEKAIGVQPSEETK
jgi:hypothetical protein